jgi:RND family efflux transporter MFP subunit
LEITVKKKILIIGTILLILALAAGLYYYFKVYLPSQVEPAPTINTTKVRKGDISITASGVGNILPKEKVSVGFQVSGILESLPFKVGDEVSAGDVLASLDDGDLQLKLSQAEASLNALFTPEAINQAELALLNARATYSDASKELVYLVSPRVFYWENALAEAQAKLSSLKAATDSSESDILAAEKAVTSAQSMLLGAQQEYETVYVPTTFPYSYIDAVSGELIETYLKPSAESIDLARARLTSAELTLADAETYLAVLQQGLGAWDNAVIAIPGSNLAKLEQSKLDYDQALLDLDKTVIKAPISGTVTALDASVGQAINTSPFITIETLDEMILKFYIEERDISLVKAGDRIEISFEAYPDVIVNGTITYMEPALQIFEGSSVAVVWATLAEPITLRLLSGMSADVEVIAAETSDALLVPIQALRELAPGSYSVFVVQPDGSLRMVVVTVGLKDYANAEILSGLQFGDIVSTGNVETK